MSRPNGGCEICGRSSCTRSFHSISEQEEHDERLEYEERGECYECKLKNDDIAELQARVERLEAQKVEILGSLTECLESHLKRDGMTHEIYADVLHILEQARAEEGAKC